MGRSKLGDEPKARPGKPAWTKAPEKKTKKDSKSKSPTEQLAELVPNATRDPRLCSQPAKQRWDMRVDDNCPPELNGMPKLDDNGRPTYRPCKGSAVKGTDRCMSHGGSLPGIKIKAEKLLEESRDVLMNALIDMALDETKEDSLRLKAIQWGLERAGFAPGVKVDVSLAPWQEMIQRLAGEIKDEEGH